MSTVASAGVRFHSGSQIIPAGAVHTTPLGYDRADIPVGAPLPAPASAELVDRLSTCDEIEVAFDGRLGDTLLALAAVRAVTDWLRLRSARVIVRAMGPYAGLIARAGLITQEPDATSTGRRAVIGDRIAVEARAPGAAVSLICDPAAPPCWASDGRSHPDLPTRYYLALERRLGIRLPGTAPFAPVLTTWQSGLVEQLRSAGWLNDLTIAAVTATSWPERKDYTAQRYIELAERIAEAQQTRVQLLLIGGRTTGDVHIAAESARRRVQVLRLDGVAADHLADLFPHVHLVVGNDTGLTHLAAMTRIGNGGGPPVIGLYARHSHSKWRTGLPHHHAAATRLSDRMHQGDLCPVRDAIAPDTDVHMDAIPPAALAQLCLNLLSGVKA
ncbi:glycosyltransferase family 9 protein [Streptomyces sp. HNM0663]|uniref:Glycosyltransferase family 9 protein n=1 Tax=Streptomyces chengmaiensis TaxID=3040919 RepID=A0ABT6HRE3_9ACTN|nr:glycosyltransferase family 9 protein [Streptomyces chengmaiensis]MDH2390872.1 glycosyltransferase family 9 protein [Streptomyces chengmaiensis]